MNQNFFFIQIALGFVVIVLILDYFKMQSFKSLFGAAGSLFGLLILVNGIDKPLTYCFYTLVVVSHYFYTERDLGLKKFFSPILYPIFFIIVIKYSPVPDLILSSAVNVQNFSMFFLGLSYVSFKMSFYAQQRKVTKVSQFTLAEYLTYVFFLPSLMVGPITKPDVFIKSWKTDAFKPSQLTALERIIIGIIKFTFVSQFFNQTTFKSMVLSGQDFHFGHLLIASMSYYMFIYFNFSGFCDVVIGLSAIARVEVQENFNRPLLARNVQDFWSRWHITLSNYMNEVVFSPLSVKVLRRVNPGHKNYGIAFCLFVIFVLIGFWHGKSVQYFIFGVLQALAVTANFFFAEYLKKRHGIKFYKSYMKNGAIQTVSTIVTFLFMCFSFIVFANDLQNLKYILKAL